MPVDTLNELVEIGKKKLSDGFDASPLTIIETTHIKSITHSSRLPMSGFNSPFVGWTVDDVYEFFKSSIRQPPNSTEGDWTAYTFIILDQQSITDKTLLLCCDAPDFGEAGEEVVLKTMRLPFTKGLGEWVGLELLNKTPSEIGSNEVMRVMPPSTMTNIEYNQENMTGRVATPEIARRNKRQGIKMAEEKGETTL
ncbi:MAG: hypothetical protein M1834_001656 [Cirrosporium novae-zelandiae]|nr:MAG: hypothetical protein M1834_004173 [Cirrosporium novae-zelandiae]KAI9735640.1 MAG: hypothetical protein M1834_001656 [Cirrosporium novae-zelandiae]